MNLRLVLCSIPAILFHTTALAQGITVVDTSSPATAVIIAGRQYERGGLYTMFWGKHYRKEWTTAVKVQKLRLDTAYGGLTPTETGGGKQTKNLRFINKNGRAYAIRSVSKDYGRALPEIAKRTFVEDILKDQMCAAHPYGSVTFATLADAIKVYHTNPKMRFIGDDKTLGKYRDSFANELYTLEDRPTSDNSKYYGAKDVLDTDNFLEEIAKDNSIRVDQHSFARARLFDMLIGDWDRHDDQWKWALYEENGNKLYRAMPKDHDQIYSKFDGILVQILRRAANLPYLQGFHRDIKDIAGFNLEARALDMQFTSQLTLSDWKSIATSMQQQLTDTLIATAIRQMPPEIFAIRGQETISILKSRRDELVSFAERYYRSLAREADIIGTKEDEYFEVIATNEGNIKVNVHVLNPDATIGKQLFSREYNKTETDELRIYGIGGNDRFHANGATAKNILIRLIGGPGNDEYNIPSSFKLKIYDNASNTFNTPGIRLHLSNDTLVHKYDRNFGKTYKENVAGILPKAGYTNEDPFFIGIGYRFRQYQWRKEPYNFNHDVAVRYSLSQKAFSYSYEGTFIKAIAGWNIGLFAEYDHIRDQDFFGIGNNTEKFTDKKNFFQYRNREISAAVSLFKTFAKHHTVTIAGLYQSVRLLNDSSNFLTLHFAAAMPKAYSSINFAGARVEYDYTNVNHPLFPNKGIHFNTAAEYMFNTGNDNSFKRISGIFGFYVPLGPLTLGIRTGASTLSGEPEFYQLNKLGGGESLRGFRRWRFYGNTAFFNQNELQWNFNVKSYLFNGKMGLLALLDNGRVWHPGETSDKWHVGYGGGIMLAPFNKISVTGTYAVSKEDKRISVRFGHFLKR